MLLALALSSVVYLERQAPGSHGPIGTGETGTGFVIASTRGASYIVTAAHVLGCNQYGERCSPSIQVRFPDAPGRVYDGQRAYSGSANTADDLAVIMVSRPVPSAIEISTANSSRVTLVGFPQSVMERVRSGSAQLHPRNLSGTLSGPLVDGRNLLSLHSEAGDSGAPLLNSSGSAVAVLQGKQNETSDIAVGSRQLANVAAIVRRAVLTHPGDRAYLLFQNAMAVDANRQNRKIFEGGESLNRLEDQLFGEAIGAGSVDAGIAFLLGYQQRIITYHVSPQVTASAVRLLKEAAKSKNAAAAYALFKTYRYAASITAAGSQKDQMTAGAQQYLRQASDLGYPYALDDLANQTADKQQAVALRERALKAYESLIRAGDADAAWNADTDLTLGIPQPSIADPRYPAFAAQEVAYQMRAARMGSRWALETALANDLQLETPAQRAELADLLRQAALNGDSGFAGKLGDAYANGAAGFTRDPLTALDFYAIQYDDPMWNGDRYEQKFESLIPGAAGFSQQLQTSAAYTNARDSFVVLHINGPDAQTAEGVVVYVDAQKIVVATAPQALSCDATLHHCSVPDHLQFPQFADSRFTGYGYGKIRLIRVTGTAIEDGMALVELDRADAERPLPNIRAAAVASAIPGRIFSVTWSKEMTPYWGIVRHNAADRRVFDYDIPVTSFLLGHPLFDAQSGALVGLVSDPGNDRHATGYPAVQEALAVAGLR